MSEKDYQSSVKKLRKDFTADLLAAGNLDDLEALDNKYLGRKTGLLNNVLKTLKDLDVEQKKVLGPLANELRDYMEKALESKREELKELLWNEQSEKEKIDLTLPLVKDEKGHYHPNTIVQREIENLFAQMGFLVLDGPELESEFYNFDGLNVPATHPAREDQDTFWLDNGLLLRSQTSSVQVRAMRKYGAPLRCIVPGRVFRNENVDASHDHTFYQLEGMMVGKEVSVANLIAMMKTLLSVVFGNKDIKVRLRPGYFPFVEPGFELDMQCTLCHGAGCPVCKQSGWIEVLPCGMIHPNVLKAGGLNSDEYVGFAFGLGLTRLVMLKYNIDNIRLLQSGDSRFLNQF
ncbi:MAG TPA: phenylalanine--tRNA ligase subunit alpha [bacterium]|nr:phenylalanine--tRNA ligase subunit alpha [bacterium]